ncbi:hypothetical protein ACVWYF_004168 [Hymenobacter sp. UYAg731]
MTNIPDHAFLSAPTASPPARMSPAEIALTLSADVLRLPYTPATRLVLAEIVSLHAATGCCDASNPHFMARLTLKHDVVNEAIQRLHEDGLIVKVVNKQAGFYRTLTPAPAAIRAKAETNPYPEKPTSYSEKPTRGASRDSRLGYSEKPTSPSRENHLPLVGIPDTNLPFNIPDSFHQPSIVDSAAEGKKRGVENPAPEAFSETVSEEPPPPNPRPAAKPKEPRRVRTAKPDVPFLESELGTPEAFAAAFAGTDFELANLPYYFQKVAAWRQKGEMPLRKDWKATASQFFLRDVESNSLVLAPGTQRHTAGSDAPHAGTRPGAYRSSRLDA